MHNHENSGHRDLVDISDVACPDSCNQPKSEQGCHFRAGPSAITCTKCGLRLQRLFLGYELSATDVHDMLHGDKITHDTKLLKSKEGKEFSAKLIFNELYQIALAPRNSNSQVSTEPCPKCGQGKVKLVTLQNSDSFYGCTNYPACKYSKKFVPHTFNRNPNPPATQVAPTPVPTQAPATHVQAPATQVAPTRAPVAHVAPTPRPTPAKASSTPTTSAKTTVAEIAEIPEMVEIPEMAEIPEIDPANPVIDMNPAMDMGMMDGPTYPVDIPSIDQSGEVPTMEQGPVLDIMGNPDAALMAGSMEPRDVPDVSLSLPDEIQEPLLENSISVQPVNSYKYQRIPKFIQELLRLQDDRIQAPKLSTKQVATSTRQTTQAQTTTAPPNKSHSLTL